jgi:hypothetical protein
MTFAAAFEFQWPIFRVGHRLDVEPQRIVQALRRPVLNGNRPEDAVPRTGEPGNDRFLDQDRSVCRDVDDRIEALNDERSIRTDRRRDEQQREGQDPADRPPPRLRSAGFVEVSP